MGLKRTALYDRHKALGARLVDFAGWEMPVQYTGVIAEHLSVRSSCGLFDVGHMGEVEITGPGAVGAIQRLFTNDIEKVSGGGCQYTLLCYPHGGVVDDCIVYRFDDERFMVVVNGSNSDKAFEWISANLPDGAEARNVSDDYALLALQGPAAEGFLQPLVNIDLATVGGFRFAVTEVLGYEAVVSRTGYTGEDGFEIYIAQDRAPEIWDHLLRPDGILPAGLGARDTLRLEMGYPLYGFEFDEATTPVEAGLHKRFVALGKPGFIGKEALEHQAAEGVGKTLVGLEITGSGIPRAGYEVAREGSPVGHVTSGTMSPSLKKGIAMAYVAPEFSGRGTELDVVIRGRPVPALVVKTPFYARKKTGGATAGEVTAGEATAGEAEETGKLYRTGLSGRKSGL